MYKKEHWWAENEKKTQNIDKRMQLEQQKVIKTRGK